MKRITLALSSVLVLAGISACGGNGGTAGTVSNPYQSDYNQGVAIGQQVIATYNVMPSVSQCQQLWSLVRNVTLTGKALSAFEEGYMVGCDPSYVPSDGNPLAPPKAAPPAPAVPANGIAPNNNAAPADGNAPNNNAAPSPTTALPAPAPTLTDWTGTSGAYTPQSGSQCVPTAWITGCVSQCQVELQISPGTSADQILSATGSDGKPIALTKGPGPLDGEYEWDNSSPLYFSSDLPSYSVTVTAEIADENDPPSVNLIMDGCS